jgi:hypothetical protein
MIRPFACMACTLLCAMLHAQSARMLFIGNSYTGVNDLPETTRQLALSLGEALVVASSAPGGYTFQQHSTSPATLGLIDQGNWDFVVLQEQSQLPSFPPGQVASDCLPFAADLVDSIRAHSPCAGPVFYMTWGRQNGDAQNCAAWPPVCTYEGMQAQLRMSYLQMAQDNSAECAPAGVAWKRVREDFPAINLYAADGSHPSVAGSYLVACTIYSTCFRSSTVGATYTSSLDAATALILQQVASSVVLDSLDTWNIGVNDPVAVPQYDDLGAGAVAFSEQSVHATDHFWDLGDGSTSTDSSFTHTYAADGTYTITYIASDGCGREDTSVFQVDIATTDITELQASTFRVTGEANGLAIRNVGETGTLELFDTQGRLLRSLRVGPRSDQRISWPGGRCVLWRFVGATVPKGGVVVVP